jgi:hypothetical protein
VDTGPAVSDVSLRAGPVDTTIELAQIEDAEITAPHQTAILKDL